MKKYADLHVHTFFSDSTFSPEEVVDTALEKGLSAVAVTDHDCVDGIAPAAAHAAPSGLEIVPGIELAVEKSGREVHILGYFIDWQAQWLRDTLARLQKSRVDRVYKIVELLKKQGIALDPETVFKIAGRGAVGRLHIAFALLKTKNIRYINEAFSKYIGFMKPCYVPHIKMSPEEAIGIIRRSGGVPVLAHPKTTKNDSLIPEFAAAGLRGIEAYHTDHGKAEEKKYKKIAEKNGLLITGGSDCHGIGKGRVLIGTVMVDYGLVEKLKQESVKIRGDAHADA